VERRDRHDDAGAPGDHVPRGQARGEEVRRRVARDRQREQLGVQLGERPAEDRRVRDADRVERDVHAPGPLDDGPQVRRHRRLLERVDLRRLRGPAGGGDLPGDLVHRRLPPPGEEDPRTLGREGACHRTADRATGAVDHRDLVRQHRCRSHAGADTAGDGNRAAAHRPAGARGGVRTTGRAKV
jgi:hypothetical protein